MSMENAEKLMKALYENPEAGKLLKEFGNVGTVQKYAEAVLSAARTLGIEASVDPAELAGYLEAHKASYKDFAAQAAGDLVEFSDDDLDEIAGGVHDLRYPNMRSNSSCK